MRLLCSDIDLIQLLYLRGQPSTLMLFPMSKDFFQFIDDLRCILNKFHAYLKTCFGSFAAPILQSSATPPSSSHLYNRNTSVDSSRIKYFYSNTPVECLDFLIPYILPPYALMSGHVFDSSRHVAAGCWLPPAGPGCPDVPSARSSCINLKVLNYDKAMHVHPNLFNIGYLQLPTTLKGN